MSPEMTGTYLYRRDFFRHSVTNKKKTQETQWWNAEGFKCFFSLMVLILQLSGKDTCTFTSRISNFYLVERDVNTKRLPKFRVSSSPGRNHFQFN